MRIECEFAARPRFFLATGPDLPFASWPSAAAQLHQTGHSFILQHFVEQMPVGWEPRKGLESFPAEELNTCVKRRG